jgi:hypothetical protein
MALLPPPPLQLTHPAYGSAIGYSQFRGSSSLRLKGCSFKNGEK